MVIIIKTKNKKLKTRKDRFLVQWILLRMVAAFITTITTAHTAPSAVTATTAPSTTTTLVTPPPTISLLLLLFKLKTSLLLLSKFLPFFSFLSIFFYHKNTVKVIKLMIHSKLKMVQALQNYRELKFVNFLKFG